MVTNLKRLSYGAIALTFVFAAVGCTSSSSTSDDEASTKAKTPERSQVDVTGVPPDMAQAGVTALDLAGPGQPELDRFNTDAETAVRPALGGRIIQHIASEPPNLNFAIENSAVIRWIHDAIHAGLLEFNVATWEYETAVARSYDIEDTVILKGGRGDDNQNIVYGKVTEVGDEYVVTSGSAANKMSERRIGKGDVESVQYGTVFTFQLRDDVYWHDGEKFDAEDAFFSWDLFNNPAVDCDEKRSTFVEIVAAEIVDPHQIRYFYGKQYFQAIKVFSLDFCLLPSHLYNLGDSTNKDFNPNATVDEQGTYINENPANIDFVGLGPYMLTKWERGQYLEAKKFDKFWNPAPEFAGYADVLRWRHIDDDNLAFQALLNGETDIFDRVKSEDYFGAATRDPNFTDDFYKAFTYVGSVGFTVWNVYQPQLSDPRVRLALGHAFDTRDWIRTNYKGLALPASFSQFRFGPAYNRDELNPDYSIEKAQNLLTDAGWYDHDGNGIVDKDGQELVIEALMPSGNKASEKFLQKLQESYEKVGIKVDIRSYEWATFLEKILDRDFDAANLAWTLGDIESDPFGSWHSTESTFDRRTSNMSGLKDDIVDDLINRGRIELDTEKRMAIWHQLHSRINELQPFLFSANVPRKIAFNKKLRGVKLYKFSPGYRLRDMYYEEGTPGTRPVPGA
jgi:peptide/nickel transport system substrate-binding protein